VRDFAAWRRVFNDEAETRRANGARRELRLHNAKEAGECWLLLEWDDLFRAELFVRSDEFRAALIKAGVIDGPECWYLEGIAPDLTWPMS
jgi:hypothetical protein